MTEDRVTVELNAWECERLVLALIQLANSTPEVKVLQMMKNLQKMEFTLVLKIDNAGKSILEKVQGEAK